MFKPIIPRMGLIAIGLAVSLQVSVAAMADVVAVVSVDSPVTSLTRNQLADIFLGRAVRFPDGVQAVPIDQEEGSVTRDEFYATFAGKSPAQLKAYWSKVIFTGRGRPPPAVANGVEARKQVTTNPRAIAYIDRSLIDTSIKVLRVE
jgi:ABC-type phosphate transport system substrate-binding protein